MRTRYPGPPQLPNKTQRQQHLQPIQISSEPLNSFCKRPPHRHCSSKENPPPKHEACNQYDTHQYTGAAAVWKTKDKKIPSKATVK